MFISCSWPTRSSLRHSCGLISGTNALSRARCLGRRRDPHLQGMETLVRTTPLKGGFVDIQFWGFRCASHPITHAFTSRRFCCPLRRQGLRCNLRKWWRTCARLGITSRDEFSGLPGLIGSPLPPESPLPCLFLPPSLTVASVMASFPTTPDVLTNRNSPVGSRLISLSAEDQV